MTRQGTVQEIDEPDLLRRIAEGGPQAWELFISACSGVIFRVACLFADGYDDRMDVFLFVCARLADDDMRRVRTFRRRPEAPCRFSTWLSVVVKNLAVDFIRSREGRYRPFRSVSGMGEADRLLFEYHVRDGRGLEESRNLLVSRHGIRMSTREASSRVALMNARLSPSQRWRLLSRLIERRRPYPLDPVADVACGSGRTFPIEDDRGDPERPVRSREARAALLSAMASVPARKRLAMILRYGDGHTAHEVAALMDLPEREADRLAREGIDELRDRLRKAGVARADLDPAFLAGIWPSGEGALP